MVKATNCKQTMMSSILVAIRPRPCDKISSIKINPTKSALQLTNRVGSTHHYTFDTVFDTSSTQDEVYDQLGAPIVQHVLSGFNSCIFAYGQSGSGKSHTIGGIVPRMMKKLISSDVAIQVGLLEIYCEKSKDLIQPKNMVKIRSVGRGTVFAEGQSYCDVSSYDEFDEMYNSAMKNRTTAATALNDVSSRSHCILSIKVKQLKVEKNKQKVINSVLHIVDLAGSERLDKSGVVGINKVESVAINKSLSTLNRVISLLASKKTGDHIPFRDSILTHILSNCLGGNSMTCMIATISLDDSNFSETENTLNYAKQAKRITNEIHANVEYRGEVDVDVEVEADMTEEDRKTIDMIRIQDEEWNRKLEEAMNKLSNVERELQVKTDQHAITQNKLAELELKIRQDKLDKLAKLDMGEDDTTEDITNLRELEDRNLALTSALEAERAKSRQIEVDARELAVQIEADQKMARELAIPIPTTWSMSVVFGTINGTRVIDVGPIKITLTQNKATCNGNAVNYGQRGTNKLVLNVSDGLLSISINGSRFNSNMQYLIQRPTPEQIVCNLPRQFVSIS